MSNEFLPEHRLRWTHGRPKRPIWPTEPSIDVIQTLAFSVLHRHFPNDCTDEKALEVKFLSEKLTKRLFVISHSRLSKRYIFQVQLPVDPFFLTENEVATLSFVRHNTDIPVPPLIAWNSSSDNILGYEWSLVEMLEGVTLGSLWPSITLGAKLSLAEDLAHIFAQLWSHEFDHIGSLYIKQRSLDAIEQFGESSSFQICFEDPPSPSFKVDKMVSMPLFIGRRCFLPSDRGPFTSSKDWMKAQICLELEYVITGQEILQLCPELGPEDINLKPTFLDSLDEFQDVCQDYFRAVPTVFSLSEREASFSLCHHGLNEENILLDPVTHKISGILDWDMTSVVPDWLAREYSHIFHGIPPDNGIPKASSTPQNLAELQKWNVFPKRLPDPEYAQLLQQRFDNTLHKRGVQVEPEKDDEEKRQFYMGVLSLGHNWELAKEYLQGFGHFEKEYEQVGWSGGFDERLSSDSD